MDNNRNAAATASAVELIHASPAIVWSIQTDLRGWPGWNPNVESFDCQGPLVPGTEFRWKAGGARITSRLQEVEPERRIGWTGRAPLGIRAVHTWSFEPEGPDTRVRTEESFEGLLARLLRGPMRRMLARSLEKSLAALKAEAERRAT